MTQDGVFARCRPWPFWLEDALLRQGEPASLPVRVDLVIVGWGYTGPTLVYRHAVFPGPFDRLLPDRRPAVRLTF